MSSIANCLISSSLFYFGFISIVLTICFSLYGFNVIASPVGTISGLNDAFQGYDTLKGVFIVMRHGVRAPYYQFPSDPTVNGPQNWPNGLAQLTDVGKDQINDIAHFIRDRYINFYPRNSANAFLRTSNVDRCIETMSIVSRVLWPPQSSPSYQPPSVYKVSRPLDPVLYWNPYCPNAEEKTYFRSKQLSEAIAFDNQYKSLYDFVAKKTGFKPNMDDMTKAFDVLRSAKYHNMTMPDWADKVVYEGLEDVFTEQLNLWFTTRDSIRFGSGMFLEELLKRIHEVTDQTETGNEENKRNFFFYVSHDYLIASIIKALGLPLLRFPNFGSGLIFELHEIERSNVLKIFYMNQTETLPIGVTKLTLPSCEQNGLNSKPSVNQVLSSPEELSSDCNLNAFEKLIARFIPNDWAKECGIEQDYRYFQVLEKYIDKSNDLIDK